jgi:hypothetical protein
MGLLHAAYGKEFMKMMYIPIRLIIVDHEQGQEHYVLPLWRLISRRQSIGSFIISLLWEWL